MAHVSQSRPDSGLGCQIKVLDILRPSLLARNDHYGPPPPKVIVVVKRPPTPHGNDIVSEKGQHE